MASNVDTRVLEMNFDNKNFEKNVSTSLNTLDKLKKSLNLDGAAKGLENVDNAANKLNFDKLVSAATALEKRFSLFGEIGAAAIHRVTNSMIDLSTKTLGFISSGITQGGLKRAMNLEQADFQLQGLLKDTKAVAAIMEDVSWSVDGTAYGLDAAAKAASMFAATGIRAGEQMKGALRGVAGVAAMTNSEYEDIARIFTTVAGQGKVMADQYNQLASRGLNAAAVVADYLTKVGDGAKVTEAEVRDMTSKGKISFQTFAAAMDDAFGEHAKAANKTFNGALSNIRAALARIGADFYSPIIKQNREMVWFLNHVRLKINEIRKQTTPFAKEMAEWVNGMLYKAAVLVKNLDFSYNSTAVRVARLNWESLLNIVTAFKQVFLAIGAGFKEVFPESASITLIDISQKIRGLTERLIPGTKAFQNIRDTSKAFFTILRDGAEVVSMVADKIRSLLSKGLEKLNINISDIPGNVARAILAFKDLGEGANIFLIPLGALYMAFEAGRKKVQDWVDAFKNLPQVQGILEKLGEVMSKFASGTEDFRGRVRKAFDDFIRSIRELDGVTFDALADLLESLRDIFANGFDNLWDNLQNFPKLLQKLRDAISEQLGNIGVVFSVFWDKLKDGFKAIWDWVSSGNTIMALLTAFFGAGLMKVAWYLGKKILPVFQAIPRLINAVVGVLTQLKKAIKQAVGGIAFKRYTEGIFNIAKAIAVLAISLTVLAQVPADQLIAGGTALTMIALAMAGLVAAFNKLDSSGNINIKGMSTTILAMSAAMFILVRAVKDISEIIGNDDKNSGIGSALGIVSLLMFELLACAKVLAHNQGVLEKGQKQMSSGISMIAFALSIKSLVKTMMSIAKMPLDKVAGSVIILTILMAEMVAMTKLTSKGGWQSGVGMLALVTSIHVLLDAVEKIGKMDAAKLVQAEIVMVSLAGVLTLMSFALRIGGGENPSKTGLGLLGAAAAILVIAYTIEKLGNLGTGVILKGLAVVTALTLVISALVVATSLAGDNALKVSVTIIAMAGAIAILTGVIAVIGNMDEKVVRQGTTVVSALIAMLALIVASTKLAGDCKSTLIIITVAVTMLAAAIGILSFMDQDRLMGASLALGLVMGMFAVVVASTSLAKKANSTLAIMVLVVAGLGAVLAGLSFLDTEKMIPAAEALAILMLALSAAFLIISKSGDVSAEAVIALAGMTIVVGMLAVTLGIMQALEIEPSMETVASLSLLLLAMTACLAILAKLNIEVTAAVQASTSLGTFITILSAFMAGLGALYDLVPGAKDFLENGIWVLEKVGEGIGRFAGAIVEGFLDQIISGLPGMADNLSAFMNRLQPFLKGAKTIDQSVVNGVIHLAGAIAAISAAQVIRGITDLLPFTGSMGSFGETLVTLGKAMAAYSKEVSGKIDSEAVEASAIAAGALAELQKSMPSTGGAWQWLFGTKVDLGTFGENIKTLGVKMREYSDEITKDGGIKTKAITDSATAAGALAELQKSLPSTGGAWQWLFGETVDLGTFGTNLAKFGESMVTYSNAITADGGINAKAIKDSAKAASGLVDLQNNLPDTGGKLREWLFGEKIAINDFGWKLGQFASALVNYCIRLKENGGIDIPAIEDSAKAAGKLVELQNALPSESGWLQSVFGGGTMDIKEWGEKLAAFAQALSNYSAQITLMNGINLDKITESVKAALILVSLQENLPKNEWGAGDLDVFGNRLRDFGQSYAAAAENLTKIEHTRLRQAIDDLQALVMVAGVMGAINADSVSAFSKSLKDLSSNGIKSFIAEFEKSKNDVDRAIGEFTDRAAETIGQNQNDISEALNATVTAGLKTIDSRQREFTSSGDNLMEKLIGGLKKNKESTNSTLKETLDYCLKTIKSPYMDKYMSSGDGLGKELIKGFQGQKESFNDKIGEVLGSGVTTINGTQGDYNNAASTLMSGFIGTVSSTKADANDSVLDIMKSMTKNISDQKGNFSTAGSTVMSSFSSGILSQKNSATNAGSTIGSAAYNGAYSYKDSFYNLGTYYVDGMSNAIDERVYRAKAAATRMAEAVDQAVRNTLKIKSPSRVAYESGGYYGEGFIDAIIDKVQAAYEAAKEMATGANDGLIDALDSTISLVTDGFNLTPVITPEIDPTKALATASQINSLFNGGRSVSLGAKIRDAEAYRNQNGNSETSSKPVVGATYQFTQNNYSPKALSRIDIYRQTKNQFTTFKEATVRK